MALAWLTAYESPNRPAEAADGPLRAGEREILAHLADLD